MTDLIYILGVASGIVITLAAIAAGCAVAVIIAALIERKH